MKNFLRIAVRVAMVLLLVFCAAVVVELVPALQTLDRWMLANGPMLVAIMGSVAGLGVFLLLGSVVSMLMEGGTPMDHAGIENHQRSMRDSLAGPRAWRASSYRLFGHGAGSQGHDEFSFAQLKAAVASGAVLRIPVWRRRLCAISGGMLIVFGVFGVAIVFSPMPLKLLLFAAVIYALARVFWGLVRA
jgi:hypothetical protein